jgi:hypothetical protein
LKLPFLNFSRPEYLKCGERARLIPVVADTSKEGRVTSAFLAAFTCVPEYAGCLLGELGFRLGKTSKIECFTETVFKNSTDAKHRPDGLIVITTGKKEWRALIEAKVGNVLLDKDQVEMYLDLAKQFNIDAVITVSNQFAATPTHHPVPVSRVKCKNVALYHWSWTHLMAEAVMWVKHHGISDPEQSYILEELVRYLDHPASGILSIERMNPQWKDVCAAVQNAAPLNKNGEDVRETVATWHQFTRSLSLKFSLAVGRTVTLALKRQHKENADLRLQEDCQ